MFSNLKIKSKFILVGGVIVVVGLAMTYFVSTQLLKLHKSYGEMQKEL